MTPRIVLVRHGPSAHVQSFRAIDHAGVHDWRRAYDAAGLRAAAEPPAGLSELATNATHIIASDLPRALESAERLAGGRRVQVSELFREAPLAIPHWPTRLPLIGWGVLIHLAWSYSLLRGTDASDDDRSRASSAADWLASLVSNGSVAVVVTHGVFRRMVGRQLIERGWMERRHRDYRPWSAWTFSRP